MSQNIVEKLREEAVKSLFNPDNKFILAWPTWQPLIRGLANTPTATQIINLGDHLHDIFQSTAAGRDQSQVAAGGANWEALICWYLNICCIGRRTVIIKHSKDLIPEPISDAMTVNYGATPSNSESDLVAITFPDLPEYSIDKDSISVNDINGHPVAISHSGSMGYNLNDVLNALTARDFANIEVHIIQCKTNWRDNAQIPMLWDMIYHANGFNATISLGQNNYSLANTRFFSYSFATTPTGNNNYTATSMPVVRVRSLSGGNYWGLPSCTGIAQSMKEMLSRNLGNGATSNHIATLTSELPNLQTTYSYFNF